MKECPLCQSCFPDHVELCPDHDQPTKSTFRFETVIHERYRLEKRIGQGSMSVVYRAHDSVRHRTKAIKIILPEFLGNDPNLSDRFLDEATAVTALHHPGIVAITDSGMLNGVVPFLVMEFVTGPSLEELLFMSGALAPERALVYISTIGSALAAAHKLGLLHGDLKPHNILIERNQPLGNAIKILDFGLSKIKSGRLQGSLVPKVSGMLRSPLYLAPEEWSDCEPDNRSDIYSLGIILYQMLAGDVPFKGKSIPAIMKQHLMSPPPPITGQSHRIPSELEAVMLHALEKDPDKRPATVEDFVAELRRSIEGGAPPAEREAAETLSQRVGSQRGELRESSAGQEDERTTEDFRESPRANLDQTIVTSTIHASPFDRTLSGHVHPSGKEELAGDRTVVINAPPSALDDTVVLASSPYPAEGSSNISNDQPLTPQNSEQAWEGSGVLNATGEMHNSAGTIDSETEQLSRSVSPVLLVAGVILVVLLIAAGVIYSHIYQ